MDYWIIQFIADPLRHETRNVGIVVLGAGAATFAGIGVSGDTVDVERFRPLAPMAGDDVWVYREWVGWFRDLCRDYAGNGDEFRNYLDTLAFRGAPFVARYGGSIEPLPGETMEQVVSLLFTDLVGESRSTSTLPFESRLEEIVTLSGLRLHPACEPDVDVEFSPGRDLPAQTVHFDYLIDLLPRTAVRVLPQMSRRSEFAEAVNQVMAAFRVAIERDFVDASRCVVLSDPIPEERHELRQYLESVARIIDVTSPQAVAEVRALLRRA